MGKSPVPSNLERTARLLNLVPYLVAHQGIDLKELAREFAVSESQLLDDLNTLWMCGLPGYTPLELIDLSFDSGYVTIRNAETLQQPRSLSRDEALTLVLGLGYLLDEIGRTNPDLSVAIEGLISKLTGSLGATLPSRVHAGSTISPLMRGALEKAISHRDAIIASYHSLGRDVVTERVIHPLEFTLHDEVEYLLAYCEKSASYRTFRLDRILSVLPANSLATWDFTTRSTQTRKIRVEISINSRLRDVYERFHLPLENSQQKRAWVESFSTDWIVREIMSFGGEVCLQSPQFDRDSVWQRSQRALAAYGLSL